MAGEKLTAAQDAASDFVAGIPADVAVGLITFDSQAQVVVEPTTEHAEVDTAIDQLTTAPKTLLYDGVVLAAEQLATYDVASALVLSDGADRGSSATLDDAVAAVEDSRARFDVVSFGQSTAQVDALTAIADASNGTVAEAQDAVALAEAFDAVAASISNRYVLIADMPEDFTATSGTISVSIPVGDEIVTDSTFVTLADLQEQAVDRAQDLPPAPEPGPLAAVADNLIWVAIGGVFLAMVIVLYVSISAATDRETGGTRGVRRRLSIYTLSGGQPVKEQETTVLGDTQVARSAVELADRVVTKRDFESAIGDKLDAAAVPLRPAEWMLIHVGLTIGSGLLMLLLFSGRLLPTVLGMLAGFLAPWMYLSIKESRRQKAFMAALPDTLQLLAGSLAAGYSMPQAVDTVVREANPPISTEFNRAMVETRLGVDLEDALQGVADRMGSVDFAWVVMAIRIQREVGGNLAEVLTTVAATLRERERLRRQVQVLSAEGRLSAWILGMLPIVFALYLILAQPDYLLPMVQNVLGWIMLGMGLILLIVGALWLRKVVKVEV
jgi:tight adherence protein B